LYLLGRSASLAFAGEHDLNITDWGTVSTGGPPRGPKRLDPTKVEDILLKVVLKRKARVQA